MSKLPSKWATIDADWGEAKRHLYSPDDASFEFHATETAARDAAEKSIREGTKIVALLEVKTLFVAKPIEYDQIEARPRAVPPIKAKTGDDHG